MKNTSFFHWTILLSFMVVFTNHNLNTRDITLHDIPLTSFNMDTVIWPPDFNNIEQPALHCHRKIDKNKNINPYLINSPFCVGAKILDSVFWLANSVEPDIYPNRRLPKVLGWNFIDDTSHLFIGHPNPDTLFYPQHTNWSVNEPLCWGPDQHILGLGTGRPYSTDCVVLDIQYSDTLIDLSTGACWMACFEILRSWTVIDSCNNLEYNHQQIIQVLDTEGPEILYPDTLNINIESHNCLGRWEVPPAWLIDNCSFEIHYSVSVDSGTILGNEISGYVVVDMPEGIQNGFIHAEDCCGNKTSKKIILNVIDNTPPNAVCEASLVVTINTNNSISLVAKDFNKGSAEPCDSLFYKVIRLQQLQGSNNGSTLNQTDNGSNCTGKNGDDDSLLDGNQIYFDDTISFCCSDINNSISTILRVFDRNPGFGPVTPSEMAKGGDLYNRFSDCVTQVNVQDKTVPTLVSPPNIVVSCAFPFDINDLSDPMDSTFGRLVTDLSKRSKVYTLDKVCHNYCLKNDKTGYPGDSPGPPSNPPAGGRACDYYKTLFNTVHPDRKYELTWGFDGYVLSSCGAPTTISVSDKRICGQGQISRKITVLGINGITVTATQTIWVVDCDPVYINRSDDCDPMDDIVWPGNCDGQASILLDCNSDMSPENPLLGKPIININALDNCASISVNYSDEIITNVPDTCFKILRTWIVIDSCQYDFTKDTIEGRWFYLQTIKIHDVVGTDNKDKNQNGLKVIPNPSNGNVRIHSENEIDNIRIVSCLGQLHFSRPIAEKHFIELNGLHSGVYILQAYNKGVLKASSKLVILE